MKRFIGLVVCVVLASSAQAQECPDGRCPLQRIVQAPVQIVKNVGERVLDAVTPDYVCCAPVAACAQPVATVECCKPANTCQPRRRLVRVRCCR